MVLPTYCRFHNSGMSDLDLNNPIYQHLLDKSGRLGVHLPHLGIHISEDYAVFYLSYNCTSRKTTLFLTASATSETRFTDMCQMSSELDLRGDPFAFISCALSESVNEWSFYSENYLNSLRNTVGTRHWGLYALKSYIMLGNLGSFPPRRDGSRTNK
jgi:hypothetical protein